MPKKTTYTDGELLFALQKGDKEAFEVLYARYFLTLCRYGYKRLQDESLVEELVQDVFVELWKKRQELDMTGQVAALLYAMLRNKALHELRALMIRAKHLEQYSILHSDDQVDALTNRLYEQQAQEKMQKAVNQLSPQCREAFTLSRYECLSYKQIAIQMGISVNTVEKHIAKALRKLKQEFKEYPLSAVLLVGMLVLNFHK